MSILGPEITAKLVQGLAVLAISQFIGKEAARKLIEQLATKFPWWSNWLASGFQPTGHLIYMLQIERNTHNALSWPCSIEREGLKMIVGPRNE
jgi:hypothetical protein